MFASILSPTEGLTVTSALLCTGASVLLGLVISLIYMAQGSYSKGFVITLAVLPVMVQMVIMMVNGNLGTGVAVLGAFSLIRFRSVPGSARDIAAIFFSMAVGLATGMGYLTFAGMAVLAVGLLLLLLSKTSFGEMKVPEKELKILIPEDLDYTEVFDDIFAQYTSSVSMERVKTTNLGSMYELYYRIRLKDPAREKEMIDQIRCRNGNLTIVCGRCQTVREEL